MSADPIDWTAMRTLSLVLAGMLLLGCFGSAPGPGCEPEVEDCSSFDEVLVQVHTQGAGSGRLRSEGIEAIDIDCSSDREYQQCFTRTNDAGGGGNFRIAATADAGSVFNGWTPGSCNSESGPVCYLEFAQSTGDTVFDITAIFDREGVERKEVTLYNGTLGTANMVIDIEVAGPLNSLGPSSTRSVLVVAEIGVVVTVHAHIGGSEVASVTCTVTAAAWQGGSTPLVDLFQDGGYVMHCNGF